MAKKSHSKGPRDNRANQLDSAHLAYHRSRGVPTEEAGSLATHAQPALDNHPNQLNPNSDAFGLSRGMNGRSGSSSNVSSAKCEWT